MRILLLATQPYPLIAITLQVRGFQVAPAELEGCIVDHPLVADVCVVGVPHTFSGEVPLAFVALTPEGLKISANEVKTSIHKVRYEGLY
jgi:4-coumarate--CoA ligase